jgi:hypothetical protein
MGRSGARLDTAIVAALIARIFGPNRALAADKVELKFVELDGWAADA